MRTAISCDEFRAAVDEAIDRMSRELMRISADDLDGNEPEFTFEDWWTHLTQIAVPEIVLTRFRAPDMPRAA